MDNENRPNTLMNSVPTSQPVSDYAGDFLASLNSQPANQNHKKSLPKWFVIAVIVFVVVCVVGAVVMLSLTLSRSEPLSAEEQAEKEFYENVYDENALSETLSGDFAAAVAKNELSNYRSDDGTTIYADMTPQGLCSAIKISCASLWNPIENTRLEKVAAINSNGLDYYLDNDNIVVMNAAYEFSDTVSALVIYARKMNFYEAFDANDVTAGAIYLTRRDIFDNVVGVPSFYVLKGVN